MSSVWKSREQAQEHIDTVIAPKQAYLIAVEQGWITKAPRYEVVEDTHPRAGYLLKPPDEWEYETGYDIIMITECAICHAEVRVRDYTSMHHLCPAHEAAVSAQAEDRSKQYAREANRQVWLADHLADINNEDND